MNRLTLLTCAIALAASMACGSTSSETTVGPTPPRCGVSVTASPRSFPHPGGRGNVAVAAARECSWTASTSASWISLTNPASGQGDGAVAYSVAQNPAASARRGSITVNGQTTEVTQEAAPCTFDLDRESFDVPAGESSNRVEVRAPSGCSWQSSASDPWITIVEGAQGSGTGAVRFQVAANPTPSARTGRLMVAGIQVTVRQVAAGAPPPGPEPEPEPPPGCTYAVEPTSASIGAGQSSGSFAVLAGDGCSWNASSDAGWLTITSGGSGSGGGQVSYAAAENTSESSRTGRITVQGAVFTVTQAGRAAPSCDFEIEPTSRSIGASGGTGSIEVDVDNGGSTCAWTAVSTVSWIQVTSGAVGAGDGEVGYRVDENTGAARTGTILVAGLTFTVNQSGAIVTITGDVENLAGTCPSTTFTVGSRSVRTTEATTFSRGNCDRHLRNGTRVRVTGVIGSGGVLTASEVRF